MKCPMQTLIKQGVGTNQWVEFFECIRKDCAWWDLVQDKCAIVALSSILTAIGAVLGRIHDEIALSRYTYRCHYCGVTIERKASDEFNTPLNWTLREEVDGHYNWYCAHCKASFF